MTKVYKQVIETCTSITTTSNFINKLNKVHVATEDQQLKNYLAQVLWHLSDSYRYLTPAEATRPRLLGTYSEPFRSLLHYCNQCAANAKPQWQIVAEQHGWQPSKAA
jgi:hypothetical protein